MNRRNFIRGLLAVGAGFMILPGAGRTWRRTRHLWVIDWEDMRIGHDPASRTIVDTEYSCEILPDVNVVDEETLKELACWFPRVQEGMA